MYQFFSVPILPFSAVYLYRPLDKKNPYPLVYRYISFLLEEIIKRCEDKGINAPIERMGSRMTLEVSPQMVWGMYVYLKECSPFNKWKLPPAHKVKFANFCDRPGNSAEFSYWKRGKIKYGIAVNNKLVGSSQEVMLAVAHEMIHLAQQIAGTDSKKLDHNADFMRRLALVAKIHMFNPKWF